MARTKAIQRWYALVTIARNSPDEAQLQLLQAIQRVPGPANNPMGALPNIAFEDLLRPGGKSKTAIDQKALLREIFTNQVEAIRFQTGILKEMDKYEDPELVDKMRDSNPLIRVVAIQSASHRRLHCEEELIKRLKDPVAAVREAAHQALVHITRGTDFGPAHATGPTLVATRNAQDEAVARWRQWLKLQSDVSEPTTKSPDR